jgi:hypothetical protein
MRGNRHTAAFHILDDRVTEELGPRRNTAILLAPLVFPKGLNDLQEILMGIEAKELCIGVVGPRHR